MTQPEWKARFVWLQGSSFWALGQTALFVQTALCSQKPLLRRHLLLLSLQSYRASDWALASDTREMSATCRRGPLEASTVIFPCDFPCASCRWSTGWTMCSRRWREGACKSETLYLFGLDWATDKAQITLMHWDLEVYLFQQTLYHLASRNSEFRAHMPGILISIIIRMNTTKIVQSYIFFFTEKSDVFKETTWHSQLERSWRYQHFMWILVMSLGIKYVGGKKGVPSRRNNICHQVETVKVKNIMGNGE